MPCAMVFRSPNIACRKMPCAVAGDSDSRLFELQHSWPGGPPCQTACHLQEAFEIQGQAGQRLLEGETLLGSFSQTNLAQLVAAVAQHICKLCDARQHAAENLQQR